MRTMVWPCSHWCLTTSLRVIHMMRNLKRLMSSINLGYAVPLSLEEKLRRLKTDPAWMTIDLPIPDGSDAVEEVLAEKIGENHFRLASSPGMIEGFAADDIIA